MLWETKGPTGIFSFTINKQLLRRSFSIAALPYIFTKFRHLTIFSSICSFQRRVGIIHHMLDSSVWLAPAPPLQSCTLTAGILQCACMAQCSSSIQGLQQFQPFSYLHSRYFCSGIFSSLNRTRVFCPFASIRLTCFHCTNPVTPGREN